MSNLDLDITNDHMVGARGDLVVILVPPWTPMLRDEALRMAAWIVATADPGGERFGEVLAAVRGT